jgi:hypothetical protein
VTLDPFSRILGVTFGFTDDAVDAAGRGIAFADFGDFFLGWRGFGSRSGC